MTAFAKFSMANTRSKSTMGAVIIEPSCIDLHIEVGGYLTGGKAVSSHQRTRSKRSKLWSQSNREENLKRISGVMSSSLPPTGKNTYRLGTAGRKERVYRDE